MMIKYFKYIFFLLIACLQVSCSYVMDSVEASITDRASYSIDAYYTSTPSSRIVVNYGKAYDEVDAGAFAGYEVYVTNELNNEYAGYSVAAAAYTLGGNLVSSSLKIATNNTYTIPVIFDAPAGTMSVDGTGVHLPAGGGIIFVRVGIVNWDEDTAEGRNANWEPYDSHYFSSEPLWFYQNKSNLSKISGSVMVSIP